MQDQDGQSNNITIKISREKEVRKEQKTSRKMVLMLDVRWQDWAIRWEAEVSISKKTPDMGTEGSNNWVIRIFRVVDIGNLKF